MNNIGYIEIQISGYNGNLKLRPDNYDIRDIIAVLENAEILLYPDNKKERQIISYRLEEGSVRNVFHTTLQNIIVFNAIIGQINQVRNIDFLNHKFAEAIEKFQNMAYSKDYTFNLKTSLDNTNKFSIDKSTKYLRNESIWIDADFYFYGKITNAGGKDKANIHISTEEFGTVRIQTPISFLEQYEENLLYKTYGIHAIGNQNSQTGEIDTSTLKFVELIDYQPRYDADYLSGLRAKAKKNWLNQIDTVQWLSDIRGNYE